MSALEAIAARFVSGNSVPVERTHITRAEFDALAAPPAAPDEAMVRDAMRYRYMRDATHTIRGAPIPVKEDCGFFVTGEALDAAIDAALTGDKA